MKLHYHPDSILRQVAAPIPIDTERLPGRTYNALDQSDLPIAPVAEDIHGLAAQMLKLMYKHRAVGLAAPQVGHSLRLVVINPTGNPRDKGGEIVALNPEILASSGLIEQIEGCLSCPDQQVPIKRALNAIVRYTNLDGELVTQDCSWLLARIWQHELDHLNGKLIIDYLPTLAPHLVAR